MFDPKGDPMTPKTVGRAQTPPPPARSPRRKAASPSPGLTKEIIIAAALAQIDEEGLESFSLRTLAKRLQVFPTAIYWYVSSRNRMLADVVAFALGGVPIAPKDGQWQNYLQTLFNAYREAVRAHPNIAPLVSSQLVSNSSVDLDFLEGLLETLSRAGFAGDSLVGAYNMVIAALVGFVTQEFAPVPTENAAQWHQDMQTRLREVDPLQFPVLAANMDLLANHAFILRWENGADAPLDRSFEIFVSAQISGLEHLLALATSPTKS
jgi:TetR/AcrR family tetracycline transcriptional repressor